MGEASAHPGASGEGRPRNVRARQLDALRASELLDSGPEPAFDRLTRLAGKLLGVPVSLVSLVDVDRQYFKSALGLPAPWAARGETPLSHSFCQHVVATEAPFVVEDARAHPRVRDNAAIDDLGVIAYAGFPIRSDDGEVIGSLCAIDTVPRPWAPQELEILQELADLAHTELRLRAALRRSERAAAERTAVIESASDAIYAVDLGGRCTLANPACATLLGLSADALVGMDMHALLHRHAAGKWADCALAHAFQDGEAVHLEQSTFHRADGTGFPVQCTASPLLLAGAPAGAVVAFRDISTRIAAADALTESEMKFRAVFTDAGVGIVITGLDGALLECNQAYERLTGYARSELLSTTFVQVTHPEDAREQRRLADDMLAGRIPQLRMDKRYLRRDGAVVWGRLTATVMRDPEGTARFIVGAVEDITAQRRASLAMRLLSEAGVLLASSLEYESTLHGMARLALPLMGDACVVELERLDGSRETLCAHVDPEHEAALCRLASSTALLSRAGVDGAPASAPHPLATALGALDVLAIPLQGRERRLGTIAFVAGPRTHTPEDVRLATELSARAVAAVENALLYREAQNATRARDDVLAVVSHDLRNPVHTITMGVSVLLEIPDLDRTATLRQLGVIQRSAQRATQLIRDLLDVTRIENGLLRLDRRDVPAADLLAEAAQLVAARAVERDIALTIESPSADVVTYADSHRLLQALDNLLGNAIKFTPAGGSVRLGARRAASRDGAAIQFEVIDSGPGIALDDQPNLFRRFWQARRTDGRGVGLGLSIVKGIVDAHGGEITVESDGQRGTAIRFTVPGRAAAGGTLAEPAAAEARTLA